MYNLMTRNKTYVKGIQKLLDEEDHFIIDLPSLNEDDNELFSCSISKNKFFIDISSKVTKDKNFTDVNYIGVLMKDLIFIKKEVQKRKEAKK